MEATSVGTTDQGQRYERVLLRLGARLDAQGFSHRLVYDDGRGGDQLALSIEREDEYLEIQLHRHAAEEGMVWIMSTSGFMAGRIAGAINGICGQVSRIASVQRGCLIVIESLCRRLAAEADAMQASVPTAALRSLQEPFPGARAMTGLGAELRPASLFTTADDRGLLTGVMPAHAATVPTPTGRRAARWMATERGFRLPAAAQRDLGRRFGSLDRSTLVAWAVAGMAGMSMAADEPHEESSIDSIDASGCACDALELGCDPSCFDLGSFDLSCFDVVPDCGVLDCSF